MARLHYADNGRVILGACDKELLDKTIEDRERGICLIINRDFFGTDEVTFGEFISMLKEADTAFLVGEETVQLAVRAGAVSRTAEIRVKGVPYVMFSRW